MLTRCRADRGNDSDSLVGWVDPAKPNKGFLESILIFIIPNHIDHA